ncbi:hypothetical protein [Janibacter terrae]|uniref:hypothetical protein n=1 Tax=Janibacter terrae TaxID=103817 RepID=UPI0031F847C5
MTAAAGVVSNVSSGDSVLWPVVSSRDAAAVASRWQARRKVPFGIVVEREGAADGREAIRYKVAEEPGIYRGVRAWSSAGSLLAGLRLYLRHYPEALRTPNLGDGVALETFMKIMTVTASQAHPGTGRGCRAHKKWVAGQTGCSEETVQRAWRIAERRLDVLRELRRARPLRMESERRPLLSNKGRLGRRMPDGSRCRQRGVTPLRAFHVPTWLAPWVAMASHGRGASSQAPTGPTRGSGVVRPQPACAGVQEPSIGDAAVDHAPLPRRNQGERIPHLGTMETCSHNPVSLRSTKGTRSARRLDKEGQSVSRRPRHPIGGERLAREIAQALGWATTQHQNGPRLSPRRTAPALADFERGGWSAQHWIATARAVARNINYPWPTSSQMIREPGAWVWWLTQHMVPDEPPADVGADPAVPPWLQPCDRPDCDGHGWLIVEPDPFTGRVVAAKCPSCPPRIREATPVQIELRDHALDEQLYAACVACGRVGATVTVRDDLPLGSAVCEPCWRDVAPLPHD